MSRELKLEFHGTERMVTLRRKATLLDLKEDVVEAAFPYMKLAVAQILEFEADIAINEAYLGKPELQVQFLNPDAWKNSCAKVMDAGKKPLHPLPPGCVGKLKMARLLTDEANRELSMVETAADATPETDGDRFFAGLQSEQRKKADDPTRGVV